MGRFDLSPTLIVAAALGATTLALPARLAAQAGPFNDSLIDRVRALARATTGERPRSLHVLKIVESAGPLSNYVAVPDSQRIASCYSAFQIRWRDRWIVVDAGLDREALGPTTRAQFFQDRYDRLQLALRNAERVVLTHEHFDHAGGVERGPYFQQIAAKTLLTDEQLHAFLNPPPRGVTRLSPDSAAAFPVLHYEQLYALAPGVVLIKAPGHTPGSQFVYVQLQNGRELLVLGDLAWQSEGIAGAVQKPEATSRNLGEDREALQPELDWARRVAARGDIAIVLSHDSRSLDALIHQHAIASDFDLRPR